jgi:hypothetical protein
MAQHGNKFPDGLPPSTAPAAKEPHTGGYTSDGITPSSVRTGGPSSLGKSAGPKERL